MSIIPVIFVLELVNVSVMMVTPLSRVVSLVERFSDTFRIERRFAGRHAYRHSAVGPAPTSKRANQISGRDVIALKTTTTTTSRTPNWQAMRMTETKVSQARKLFPRCNLRRCLLNSSGSVFFGSPTHL